MIVHTRALAAGPRGALPTFKELGYPIAGNGWMAIYATGGTPRPVVDRLNQAVVEVLHQPEVRQKLANRGFEVTGTSPEKLAAIMRTDSAKWAPVIQASGFKAA